MTRQPVLRDNQGTTRRCTEEKSSVNSIKNGGGREETFSLLPALLPFEVTVIQRAHLCNFG